MFNIGNRVIYGILGCYSEILFIFLDVFIVDCSFFVLEFVVGLGTELLIYCLISIVLCLFFYL